MTHLENLLAEVRAADAAATKGPWRKGAGNWIESDSRGYIGGNIGLSDDAHFIAKSRTYIPVMARVIEVLLKYGDFPSGLKDGGYGDKFRAALAATLAGSEGGGE